MAEQYQATDPAADAKLEAEAREEERIINKTCDELGVKMHEVRPNLYLNTRKLMLRCRSTQMAIVCSLQ